MEEKVYFMPGDIVTLKQDIPNKPKMLVICKVTSYLRPKDEDEKTGYFKGIKCRWFTTSQELQESIFNTKDLVRVK